MHGYVVPSTIVHAYVYIFIFFMRVCSVRCTICRVISTSVRGIELWAWFHSYFGRDIVHAYLPWTSRQLLPVSALRNTCIFSNMSLRMHSCCGRHHDFVSFSFNALASIRLLLPTSGSQRVRTIRELRTAQVNNYCLFDRKTASSYFIRQDTCVVRGTLFRMRYCLGTRHTLCLFTFSVSPLQQCTSRLVL